MHIPGSRRDRGPVARQRRHLRVEQRQITGEHRYADRVDRLGVNSPVPLHALEDVQTYSEGFTPALVEALKLHQAYWTLNEERTTDIKGSIALGPLAIACLADDGELPIDVESEYLPKHLLEHTWLGEFPT